MAVPAYATDLTDITTSFTMNWNLLLRAAASESVTRGN